MVTLKDQIEQSKQDIAKAIDGLMTIDTVLKERNKKTTAMINDEQYAVSYLVKAHGRVTALGEREGLFENIDEVAQK